MTLLWSLIKSNLPASLAFALVLTLATALMVERFDVAKLTREGQTCRTEGESLSLSNAALLASLREQNLAIEKLSEEGKKKKALSQKAESLAVLQSNAARVKAQKIENALPGGDECEQMKALMKQFTAQNR